MGGFLNGLRGVSAAALLTSVFAHKEATRPRDDGRPTPRKPERPRDDGRPTPRKPERPKPVKEASVHRANRRFRNRFATMKQRRKETDIGVDPIYLNGPRADREALSKAWRKRSREWDRQNAGKVF